jgi:putative transposase
VKVHHNLTTEEHGSVANFSDLPRYAPLLCVVKEGVKRMAVEFKGVHLPKSVLLYVVFFYVRYPVSYRELQGFP